MELAASLTMVQGRVQRWQCLLALGLVFEAQRCIGCYITLGPPNARLMQTASAVIFWEYERQKGKDIARAAKEKAFQEGNDEDKRVSFPIFW